MATLLCFNSLTGYGPTVESQGRGFEPRSEPRSQNESSSSPRPNSFISSFGVMRLAWRRPIRVGAVKHYDVVSVKSLAVPAVDEVAWGECPSPDRLISVLPRLGGMLSFQLSSVKRVRPL